MVHFTAGIATIILIFSIVADILVIFHILRTRERNVMTRLIFSIVIFDLCEGIGDMADAALNSTPDMCQVIVTLSIVGSAGALTFSSLIPMLGYYTLTRGANSKILFIRAALVCLLLNLLLSPLPLFSFFPVNIGISYDDGYDKIMCALIPNTTDDATFTLTMIIYGPVLIGTCMLFTILYFFLQVRYLKRSTHIFSKVINTTRLVLFPAIQFISYLPQTIIVVFQVYETDYSEVVIGISRIFDNASGILNGLIYFLVLANHSPQKEPEDQVARRVSIALSQGNNSYDSILLEYTEPDSSKDMTVY